MALSTRHIPLSCSLRERVTEEFAPENPSLSADTLSTSDLVTFLGKSKDTDSSPLATIRRRAAKQNRSAELRPEDHATLSWVCEAFADWEEQYPLEAPLRDHVHRLLPLAAAMAFSDESFFTPGEHPLHRLLDVIQAGAVGWQVRLDRAGQMLEQRVERAVAKALEWFANRNTDIAAITREFESATDRDAARAQRMVQRLAETEEARLKTLNAKRDAARMINRGLDTYELPAAIGEFLKGPWYDSAQMALVKFGERSREWEQIERATRHLMESVQQQADGEAERDRQEQILRHLPGDLRRWLISLEHDSDATDSAIGLVEYAHLRIQHGQKLQLVQIAPLAVEDDAGAEQDSNDSEYHNGDWYRFEDSEGELRAQLVLQLEKGQHLLFTNFVGLKALDLSRRAFSLRVHDGFAVHLPCRDSFSLSLAATAGLNNDDDLARLLDPDYEPPVTDDAADADTMQESEPEPTGPIDADNELEELDLDLELDSDDADDGSDAAPGQEQEDHPRDTVDSGEAVTWDDELPSLGVSPEDDPVLAPPEGAETELAMDFDSAASGTTSAPAAPAPAPAPAPPAPTPAPESTPAPAAPQAPAPAPPPPQPPPPPPVDTPPPQEPTYGGGYVTPEPQPANPAPPASPAYAPPSSAPPVPPATESMPQPAPSPPPAPEPTPPPAPSPPPVAPPQAPPAYAPPTAPPPQAPPQEPPAYGSPGMATPPPPPPSPATAPPPPAPPPTPEAPAAAPADTREVEVPMGAWLGFHDGETPIMAKLAVFDPRRDNYIFVNRKGIAMRELNRAELLSLMDRGLVDILETRCYFRDEVERARGETP